MVTTPVYLGFAGAHSTGTTTLAKRIEMELRAEGVTVARSGGLAKKAASLGFPKMTRHTAASTEWIITAGAAAALEAGRGADVVLIERSAIDAVAYYLAALDHQGDDPDPEATQRLIALAELACWPYALHLATALDPALPLAPKQGADPDYQNLEFRAATDRHLHELLKVSGLRHEQVTSSSHADAVNAALTAVHKHLDGAQ
jgi:hypothetical protein